MGTILDSRALFKVGDDWCGVILDYTWLPRSCDGLQSDGQFLLPQQTEAVHTKASDVIWVSGRDRRCAVGMHGFSLVLLLYL